MTFDNVESHFLAHLLNNGDIDHLVFSLYTNKKLGKMYIKLGSMDLSGLNSTANVVSTIDHENWTLNISDITMLNADIHQKSHSILFIEPSLPYIYFSKSVWELYSLTL